MKKSRKQLRPEARGLRQASGSSVPRRQALGPTKPQFGWGLAAGLGVVVAIVVLVFKTPRQEPVPQETSPSVRTAQTGEKPFIGTSNSTVPVGKPSPAQEAVPPNEETVDMLSQRASKLIAEGVPEDAIKLLQQALALKPDDENLHFDIGIAYAQTGSFTNAEHHYREALRLLPDNPEAHNNLGNLMLRSGRFEEAEKHFKEALEQFPEYPQAHNNLGLVLQRQNLTNEALACFQKAVEYDTNYWQGHYNLGKAYLMQNNQDQAITALQEAVRINPSFAPAQQALRKASGATLTGASASP
ncbi:MAG TPA: tetratricopeptide repeat protein [Clostridia bacterium]|nr:tetratricopeptide repeat protein [Clostridia bacterium]